DPTTSRLAGRALSRGRRLGGHGHLTVGRGGKRNSPLPCTGCKVIANGLSSNDGVIELPDTTLYCGTNHPGDVTVSNSGTNTFLSAFIGVNDTGTLSILVGGSVNLVSNLVVSGLSSSATGMVMMTGDSLTVTNGVFAVGNNGTVG